MSSAISSSASLVSFIVYAEISSKSKMKKMSFNPNLIISSRKIIYLSSPFSGRIINLGRISVGISSRAYLLFSVFFFSRYIAR